MMGVLEGDTLHEEDCTVVFLPYPAFRTATHAEFSLVSKLGVALYVTVIKYLR
jgi:hypothetical protein